MRLYHHPQTRSNRIAWLFEELGVPYDVALLDREQRQSHEHRARHPLGRVPVLHDGEGYVFESGALALQIADLHLDRGLIPPLGTHARALVYQWVFFAYTELEGRIVELAFRDLPEETTAATRAALADAVEVVDDALAGREFLVGDAFSVADLLTGAVLLFGRNTGSVSGFANVDAYLDRLDARPARRRALGQA